MHFLSKSWQKAVRFLPAIGVAALPFLSGIPDTKPQDFDPSTEGKTWAIRFGAEPIDLHLTDQKKPLLKKIIEGTLNISAGIGSVFNHNYIEVGTIRRDGAFETRKRITGVGLDQNWQMAPTGRLVGLVLNEKHTLFNIDPIQVDDGHPAIQNQLQHAQAESWLGDPYTKIISTGDEKKILGLYGMMIQSVIEFNNRGFSKTEYSLLGQTNPNSNSFAFSLQEALQKAAANNGSNIMPYSVSGWDIGSSYKIDFVEYADMPEDIDTLREYVDSLERTAAEQIVLLQKDLKTETKVSLPSPER